VPLVLLSLGNAQDYCLGRIVRDRFCLLQKGLCDVAKHELQKVEVKDPMIHIMTPATKQTKFAAYETPSLALDLLTDLQYDDLIRDQHPVKEENFENESEFNEIKFRATRKPAFTKSFTPRKKVKFAIGAPLKMWACLTWALRMTSRLMSFIYASAINHDITKVMGQ
jgi:hypothetical protein